MVSEAQMGGAGLSGDDLRLGAAPVCAVATAAAPPPGRRR